MKEAGTDTGKIPAAYLRAFSVALASSHMSFSLAETPSCTSEQRFWALKWDTTTGQMCVIHTPPHTHTTNNTNAIGAKSYNLQNRIEISGFCLIQDLSTNVF